MSTIRAIRLVMVLLAMGASVALASALAVTRGDGSSEPPRSALTPTRDGAGDGRFRPALAQTRVDISGGVPRGPEIDFCPSRAQTKAHLKRYGFDYKPRATCGSGPAVPSSPSERPPAAPRLVVRTFHEAQERFDPTGNPNILVGKDPDGPGYIGLEVLTRKPIPPDVTSFKEFRAWVKRQELHGKRGQP
jgi:hypothetical protein